jgi:biofilm protein TabA
MILSAISDFKQLVPLHPRFAALAEFLDKIEVSNLPEGRMEIEGSDLFVIVNPTATTRAEAPLEAHRTYIDVQVIVKGLDTMGWAPLSICHEVSAPYDIEKDIVFFKETPLSLVPIPAGHLAVFFPNDAHAPLIGDGSPVHKLVFKIRA